MGNADRIEQASATGDVRSGVVPVGACATCRERRNSRDLIAAYYRAAFTAMTLAHAYKSEPWSSGRRESECVETALTLRGAIARERVTLRALPFCDREHGE